MTDGLIRALLVKGTSVAELDWNGVRLWRPDQGLLWVHLARDARAAAAWSNYQPWRPARC